MLTHYATMTYFGRWLDKMLFGTSIFEVFSQMRNELVMRFEKDEFRSVLRISVEPRKNFVYALEDMKRAKQNSIDLFPEIIGKTITSINTVQYDRILLLHCSGNCTVAIQMYGSSANVLAVDGHKNIIDAFVRAKEIIGKSYSDRPAREIEELQFSSFDGFHQTLGSYNQKILRDALKSMFPYFGKTLLTEIFYQTQMEAFTPISSVTIDREEVLFRTIRNLIDHLAEPNPRIYYNNNTPIAFSIIPLSHLINYRCQEYESINEAIRVYVSKSRQDEHFEKEKHELQQRLHTEILRIGRAIDKIRLDLVNTDRAALYENYGKILMTYASSLTQLQEKVVLDDPVTGVPTTIPLNVRLTPVRNAEQYFDRAKKAKVSNKELKERLIRFEHTLSELQIIDESISRCMSGDDLKECIRLNKKKLQVYQMIKSDKNNVPIPFRIFHVVGGFEVWAGKTSKNNDELTLHYAKPNDLWFHARGSGGSHVVLRIGTGNGEPSKKAKEQAAAIAAYYSKQRNAKYVPVAMTEKKYVRKPKGASVGTVILEREKVLMVTPALPPKDPDEP